MSVAWAVSILLFCALGRCCTHRLTRVDVHTTHKYPHRHSLLRCMEAKPLGPDRNNKQEMIHDGDRESIQQDHLSDLI